jgi:hypothetical protein
MDVKDVAESQAKLIEFNGAIIEAQQKILAAQQDQALLVKEVETLNPDLVK